MLFRFSTSLLAIPVSQKNTSFVVVVVVFFKHCKPSVFSSLNLKLRKSRMFSYASVGDPLGLLKVTVVQGKRLVIRDFKSSDPYVVVKLGNQMAKTKVINSCLNPVWNEELTFNPTEPIGVLNLEVFDKDFLKTDDKMGHAHLSLQPIVSAARLGQILRVSSSGETTLRKVVPDSDNCLVRESTITGVDGEVVQSVWLRLCDVESGELELKIKLSGAPVAPSR